MSLIDSDDFKTIVDLARKDENIVALVLFGSYAKGNFKENSDVDLCIIRQSVDILPCEFDILSFRDRKAFDILFYDNLPDIIKFRIFSEGKILVVNDKKKFLGIRRKFLHKFRDEYPYYEYNMRRMIANV